MGRKQQKAEQKKAYKEAFKVDKYSRGSRPRKKRAGGASGK
jgi:hypothetical protein